MASNLADKALGGNKPDAPTKLLRPVQSHKPPLARDTSGRLYCPDEVEDGAESILYYAAR
jgi:hypothetical protein